MLDTQAPPGKHIAQQRGGEEIHVCHRLFLKRSPSPDLHGDFDVHQVLVRKVVT